MIVVVGVERKLVVVLLEQGDKPPYAIKEHLVGATIAGDDKEPQSGGDDAHAKEGVSENEIVFIGLVTDVPMGFGNHGSVIFEDTRDAKPNENDDRTHSKTNAVLKDDSFSTSLGLFHRVL